MSVSIILDHGTTFTQWDTGRYVYIEGYDQSSDVKVHFTTSDSGVAFSILPVWETNKWKAGVPNTVLTPGLPVNIYIYDESESGSNRTVYKFVVGVESRSKPSDYIYDAYEKNTLQWPYEENIEEILRTSTVIFESESERVSAENVRKDDEIIRTANETDRQNNERTRQTNETLRQATLANLEQTLSRTNSFIQEVTNARGDYNTLGERLNVYGLDVIISGITIRENGDIVVTKLNGDDVIVGTISGAEGYYITDLSKTGGTGLPGSTDQYTITLNNGATHVFNVYNGADGATFIPSVASDGTLSWTNNKNLPNPAPVNLKGDIGFTFTPVVSPEGILSWSNDGGLPNPEPVDIKGMSGEVAYMFTPHVSEEGVLSWSNDGDMPNPDPVNLKGAPGSDGVTYIPFVDENGILSWTNDAGRENPQPRVVKGANGDNGTTFIPSVSDDGDLSWSNIDDKPNPTTKNIKGPKGDEGITFTPSIDENGVLSWSNNGGVANPPPVSIKGPKGDVGSGGDADTLENHPASYFATADHSHDTATHDDAGFMSTRDKTILDTMTDNDTFLPQNVGVNASPMFNVVTASKIIGAVYA